METVSVSAVWELFVPILFRLFVLVAGYVRWDDMAVVCVPHWLVRCSEVDSRSCASVAQSVHG